jgi:hypothetical protein
MTRIERLEYFSNEEIMRGNLIVATEPLAAKIRCVLPSWIAAATAAAGARCASWKLASGLVVILPFLDDCGIFDEECKKKSLE